MLMRGHLELCELGIKQGGGRGGNTIVGAVPGAAGAGYPTTIFLFPQGKQHLITRQ